MGGLHDDRDVEAGFAHARQHAEAVEIGHHQVEHHAVDGRLCGPVSRRTAASPPSASMAPVAEAADHGLEQAALDRIVVDDEHDSDMSTPQRLATVPIWCNVAGLA